jgi:hypothetical protein
MIGHWIDIRMLLEVALRRVLKRGRLKPIVVSCETIDLED